MAKLSFKSKYLTIEFGGDTMGKKTNDDVKTNEPEVIEPEVSSNEFVKTTFNFDGSGAELKSGNFIRVTPLNMDRLVCGVLHGVNPQLLEANAYVQFPDKGELRTEVITMSDCELMSRS